MMAELAAFLSTASYITVPILLAALGGMICERSGVVNIALEGIMGIGAFVAGTLQFLLLTSDTPLPFFGQQSGSWVLISLAAILAGMLFSGLLAIISVSFNGNQTVVGIGMNFLALGLSIYLSRIIFQSDRTPTFPLGMVYWGKLYPSTYIGLTAVLAFWFLFRFTRLGMRISSCGENPGAAATAGLNVRRLRYTAVLTSGAMAGLGGAYLILTTTTQYASTSINGQGFIALATVAFGKWQPFGILTAAFVFGSATTLSIYSSNLSWNFLRLLPSEIFNLLPYLITLLSILLFSRKNRAPKALGRNFDISTR
ncbi:ABC transporter permease [Candidatus Haliotispira prima]|uniref:ABC transporter permease n=1 Tax=Candidatus Haliotispira prima TaxID=3034016 RepID=A0ABY8MDP4_9SPIO|nr:ABC transporter permease [Candidatus Haliotispira prima]